MKTIVIGDIHGHDSWKQIVENETDADRVIFIGDYFDSFTVPGLIQIRNFQDIIDWKETAFTNAGKEDQHKTNVIMLIGNHDYHYFPEVGYTGCSGFQNRMAPSINHVINHNREHLQMCYQMDEFVFSHAGICETWMNKQFGDYANFGWSEENIATKVNELFTYQPRMFNFTGMNDYGDNIGQTPIWIRPRSLQKSNYDLLRNIVIQVVGHTPQRQIDIEGKSTGGRYYYIDTMPREYLIINDGIVSIGKLN
jgi:predicted phosphodiesterase